MEDSLSKAQVPETLVVRNDLVRELESQLIGPAGGIDEVLDESPLNRYISGVLYPLVEGANPGVALADQDDVVDEDSDGSDPGVASYKMDYPSAAGITFAVDSAVKAITVQVA